MTWSNLDSVPAASGVYCLFDGKIPIYIGKANVLRQRLKKHFERFSTLADSFTFQIVEDDYQRTATERWLIIHHKPQFNVRLDPVREQAVGIESLGTAPLQRGEDEFDVVELVKARIVEIGSLRRLAKVSGVSRQTLYNLLAGGWATKRTVNKLGIKVK